MSNKTDKIILEFPVLWEGWECDSTGWVMERADGTRYLRMTSHGGKYEGELDELHERISEYERVLAETRKALDLLTPEGEKKC